MEVSNLHALIVDEGFTIEDVANEASPDALECINSVDKRKSVPPIIAIQVNAIIENLRCNINQNKMNVIDRYKKM